MGSIFPFSLGAWSCDGRAGQVGGSSLIQDNAVKGGFRGNSCEIEVNRTLCCVPVVQLQGEKKEERKMSHISMVMHQLRGPEVSLRDCSWTNGSQPYSTQMATQSGSYASFPLHGLSSLGIFSQPLFLSTIAKTNPSMKGSLWYRAITYFPSLEYGGQITVNKIKLSSS